mgnify:CR=1 FL=1
MAPALGVSSPTTTQRPRVVLPDPDCTDETDALALDEVSDRGLLQGVDVAAAACPRRSCQTPVVYARGARCRRTLPWLRGAPFSNARRRRAPASPRGISLPPAGSQSGESGRARSPPAAGGRCDRTRARPVAAGREAAGAGGGVPAVRHGATDGDDAPRHVAAAGLVRRAADPGKRVRDGIGSRSMLTAPPTSEQRDRRRGRRRGPLSSKKASRRSWVMRIVLACRAGPGRGRELQGSPAWAVPSRAVSRVRRRSAVQGRARGIKAAARATALTYAYPRKLGAKADGWATSVAGDADSGRGRRWTSAIRCRPRCRTGARQDRPPRCMRHRRFSSGFSMVKGSWNEERDARPARSRGSSRSVSASPGRDHRSAPRPLAETLAGSSRTMARLAVIDVARAGFADDAHRFALRYAAGRCRR